jgi:hypothetical protein
VSDLLKSHDKKPEIIYQLGMANCPADILENDLGEECVRWLSMQYSELRFAYDAGSYKVLLQPGHELKDEQIGAISNDAATFIAGLKHGVELARGKRWPGSFQYSGMALLKHKDGHYEIAEMRKVIDNIKRFEGKAFPYDWRELFGDETPREFRFNREDTDESGERNERVLLDGPSARSKDTE